MKESKGKRLLQLLAEGISKAAKTTAPPDGMMKSLVYETSKNGWHYQVEYVHDTRMYERPFIVAYGFAPPRRMFCRSADIYAMKLM